MIKFIKPFFLGIIAAGGALVLELLFLSFFPAYDFSTASLSLNIVFVLIVSAIIEEFFKLLIIYKSLFIQKDSSRDFLYSSLFLGFGFALTEIAISNYFTLSESPNLYLGVMGIILLHTLSAGLIGYLLLKIRTVSFSILAAILSVATALHFAYNFAVILGYLQK